MRPLALAFFFFSGLCGLLYEVVWIRVAGTVIGNTTYAVGTVVGVYMGGLALGAWLGGRAADRRSGARLLRLYGLLEGAVALSALAVPPLLALSAPVFRALWNSVGEIAPLYAALRAALVVLLLITPTTLMGATLPILTRFLTDRPGSAPREAGRAYAVNTFGGVAGTLAAGLWLIPAYGLRAATFTAAALNLAIAAASLLLARGPSGAVQPVTAPAARLNRVALAAAALSGLAALVYEVAWTRALVLALGSTVYAFTLILTAFILGLALGAALASILLPRFRDAALPLAAAQTLVAVAALLLLPFLGDLPLRIAGLVESARGSHAHLLWTQFGLVALFVLLPTVFLGAVFPLACRLAGGGEGAEGRSVAAVYTWNTIGSIAGSLGASFLIVPHLGLAAAVKIAATVNLGLAAFLVGPRRAAVPVLMALAAWTLLPSWNPKVMASGAFLYGAADLRGARDRKVDFARYLEEDTELLDQHWDSYGLVTVHRKTSTGLLTIRVNGKNDASTGPADRADMLFVGHLPMLHHPAPKRALLIGLGGGLTLQAMARHPVERLECIEISPAVVRAAAHFREANGNVLADPRVRLIDGDGRHALAYGRGLYDVIVSQPSNLWISGMANLFTRECFDDSSRRLAPGGIFGQWIHAYWLSRDDFRQVLRTFYSVFPHGSVWEIFPGSDYLLLGSRDPLPPDPAGMRSRLASTRALDEYLHGDAYEALLGHLVTDAPGARAAAGAGPLITDDFCSIEYTAPRSMYQDARPEILRWLGTVRQTSTVRQESRAQLAEAVRLQADGRAIEAFELLVPYRAAWARDPRIQLFLEMLSEDALRAALRDGQIHLQEHRLEDARKSFALAKAADPKSFQAAAGVALTFDAAGDYARAAEAWRETVALEGELGPAYFRLAYCLWKAGRRDEAKVACQEAVRLGHPDAADLLRQLQ